MRCTNRQYNIKIHTKTLNLDLHKLVNQLKVLTVHFSQILRYNNIVKYTIALFRSLQRTDKSSLLTQTSS